MWTHRYSTIVTRYSTRGYAGESTPGAIVPKTKMIVIGPLKRALCWIVESTRSTTSGPQVDLL